MAIRAFQFGELNGPAVTQEKRGLYSTFKNLELGEETLGNMPLTRLMTTRLIKLTKTPSLS
jgi:hypothetical protein